MVAIKFDGPRHKQLTESCKKSPLIQWGRLVYSEHNGFPIGFGVGMHGTVPYVLGALRTVMMALPKGTFLDLGSGSGEAATYAAKSKWDAYGIEVSRKAYELSKEKIDIARDKRFIKKIPKIGYGNFFPKGFDFRVDSSGGYAWDGLEEMLLEAKDADPYQEIGLDISHVDLFYHFQVAFKKDILNLFSEQAKSGAMLFFVASLEDECSIPENVDEMQVYKDFYLYEKK